jgi:hypothetical protein
MNIDRFDDFNMINEATTEKYKYRNQPHEKIEKSKEWIRNNPTLARRKETDADFFEIEVFGYDHKKEANELYKALKDSGYLDKHPLFRIRLEPM